MSVTNYQLCSVCEHTPAFCYCNGTGMSRAEYRRRQQEIITENLLNDDEFQWHVIRKMVSMIEERYFGG